MTLRVKKKKVSTKILKMDENNQHGNAMTRPLPYSCIKRALKVPSLLEFNRILDSLPHEDKIGHLFIVDIKFFNENEKTLSFNETYIPISEKEKIIEPHYRSVLQLMSIINRNDEKDITRQMKASTKTHATLDQKKFIPLYAEHVHFLVKRAGWLVTKSYHHFSFAQSKYKKDYEPKIQAKSNH